MKCMREKEGAGSVLKVGGVVVQQDVPALDLLVFVLQTLPFGLDAQPAASCSGTRSEVTEVITTVRRGVKHEARGPNPARHVTLSGP